MEAAEVDGEPGPIAESTFGLVHLLCKTGGYVGAILRLAPQRGTASLQQSLVRQSISLYHCCPQHLSYQLPHVLLCHEIGMQDLVRQHRCNSILHLKDQVPYAHSEGGHLRYGHSFRQAHRSDCGRDLA